MAAFVVITAIVGGVRCVVTGLPFNTVTVGESGVRWILAHCWGISNNIILIISVFSSIYEAFVTL